MDVPPFPKRRDVLKSHLECKIKLLQPCLAQEIIPLLITNEKSSEELLSLLENDVALEEAVDRVVLALDKERRDSLGTELFHSVSVYEQELSAQVTGMLLELPIRTINFLLENPKELKNAITKAKKEYLLHLMNNNTVSSPNNEKYSLILDPECCIVALESEDKELGTKEHIGEGLFEKVRKTHPREASKITGMLLQMDYEQLHRLLIDELFLKEKVELSLGVLKGLVRQQNCKQNVV